MSHFRNTNCLTNIYVPSWRFLHGSVHCTRLSTNKIWHNKSWTYKLHDTSLPQILQFICHTENAGCPACGKSGRCPALNCVVYMPQIIPSLRAAVPDTSRGHCEPAEVIKICIVKPQLPNSTPRIRSIGQGGNFSIQPRTIFFLHLPSRTKYWSEYWKRKKCSVGET